MYFPQIIKTLNVDAVVIHTDEIWWVVCEVWYLFSTVLALCFSMPQHDVSIMFQIQSVLHLRK